MAYNELYQLMEPGVVYDHEELLDLMRDGGYRITDPEIARTSVSKLYRNGMVIMICDGLHMRPNGPDSERIAEMFRQNIAYELLSVLSTDCYIPIRDIMELQSSIGTRKLPKNAVMDCIQHLTEEGKVSYRNGYGYRLTKVTDDSIPYSISSGMST